MCVIPHFSETSPRLCLSCRIIRLDDLRMPLTFFRQLKSLPVLRTCRHVPCPKVRLEASFPWVSHKLIVIVRNLADHEKDRKGEGRKCVCKGPRNGPWERIELSAAELNKFISAWKTGIQKGKRVPLGEWP